MGDDGAKKKTASFRVTEGQYDRIEEIADRLGYESTSEYLRESALRPREPLSYEVGVNIDEDLQLSVESRGFIDPDEMAGDRSRTLRDLFVELEESERR